MYDTVEVRGAPRAVVNTGETTSVQAKLAEIKLRFDRWVWADPQRAERLAAIYNDRYNCLRERRYDGSHLQFPGMSRSFEPRQVILEIERWLCGCHHGSDTDAAIGGDTEYNARLFRGLDVIGDDRSGVAKGVDGDGRAAVNHDLRQHRANLVRRQPIVKGAARMRFEFIHLAERREHAEVEDRAFARGKGGIAPSLANSSATFAGIPVAFVHAAATIARNLTSTTPTPFSARNCK